jgi:hypothetical protein
MIYVFAGDDTAKKVKAYQNFLESLPKDMEVFFVISNAFDFIQIESFFSGGGLFSQKSIIVFQNVFEREEIKDFILEKLELMSESKNDFVFLEGKFLKATLDAFKKVRAELNIFELSKAQKEKFDNFLLANALGQRDKLKLWFYARQAIDLGVNLEELVGVLFWKVKDLILKRNFSKLSEQELKNYAAQLAYLLPQARLRGADSEAKFENFLLNTCIATPKPKA